MDTIISFCKENYDFITLAVGILGVLIGILSVFQANKDNKSKIKSEIKKKEAQLRVLNDSFTTMGIDHTVADKIRTDRSLLEAEIKELKKQLK